MTDKFQKLPFRLAMRHEGKWWNAYVAEIGSMKKAQHIASIRMTLVESKERHDEFLHFMQTCLADMIEEIIGQRPEFPEPPQPAPESERSGHG